MTLVMALGGTALIPAGQHGTAPQQWANAARIACAVADVIVEAPIIRHLLDTDTIVVAAGDGGVPLIRDGGALAPIDGVIDKFLSAGGEVTLITDAEHVRAGMAGEHGTRIVRDSHTAGRGR